MYGLVIVSVQVGIVVLTLCHEDLSEACEAGMPNANVQGCIYSVFTKALRGIRLGI